ncbi:C1 family peptidase [Cellulophaga sp. BC115SP]|uniref:C1 family peptidase n=1 Tax=Cellulophaga sp. BC115SP TaxID=2683263 RepID=UPI001412EC94|nr:C1 family peptidase [Cellulophaga sp. BC115SP]NBB31518.1 DUF4384 domain-containing protein [Cellulophaga sp. BC115SP]
MKRTSFNLLALVTILSLTLGGIGALAQKPKYKLGLTPDDRQYSSLKKRSKDFKFRGILPPAYSLLKYSPPIGDQGNWGTCVGWSTAYYMRTTMEARKLNLSDKTKIFNTAFSPSYVYERIKRQSSSSCDQGTRLPDALEVLKNQGAAKLSCAPYDCGKRYDNCNTEAANFKIAGYTPIIDLEATMTTNEKILKIKSALVETQNPVVIGMMVPESFFLAKETWKASPNETIESSLGGHAMAIIGYDDEKGGFLISNSWGTKWGQEGYTWANYADLVTFTPYAYEVVADIEPTPNVVTMSGKMELLLNAGGKMEVVSSNVKTRGITVTSDKSETQEEVLIKEYSIKNAYPSNTSFKASISNSKSSYVYIIGSDDSNSVSSLFPYKDGVSALIPSNNMATLPANNASFTLDSSAGNDYFLVLYSANELDINQLSQDIRRASGTFTQKVLSAVGKEIISANQIDYQAESIGFALKGDAKGTVVPLIVKIKHQN